nr:MAG TPA: hypothetical protein [Caudoviricetes sp.]
MESMSMAFSWKPQAIKSLRKWLETRCGTMI